MIDPGPLFMASGPFNPRGASECVPIPKNTLVVQHEHFQGHDMGLRVLVRPDEFDTLSLPIKEEVNENEHIVLLATSSLKSSYAGISDYRFHEANRKHDISREDWNKAVASLQDKGLLNKAKAITTKGRNIVEGEYF